MGNAPYIPNGYRGIAHTGKPSPISYQSSESIPQILQKKLMFFRATRDAYRDRL
jgi:hypothetical protein